MAPHITTRITTTAALSNDHAMGPTPAQQRGINAHRPFTICVDAGATKTHAALVFTDAAQEAGGGSENLFETMVGCGSCSALGPHKSSETLRSAVVSVLNQAGITTQHISAAPRGQDAATPPPSPCDDDLERRNNSNDEQCFDAQRHGDGHSMLYQHCHERTQPLRNCQAIWIGVAGISSPEVEDDVKQHAIQWLEPLGLDIAGGRLFLGNDALLLGTPLLDGQGCCSQRGGCAPRKAICLIAGTGSIGFALGVSDVEDKEEEEDDEDQHYPAVNPATSGSTGHNFGGEDTVMVEHPTQLAKTVQKPRLLTPDNLTTLAQAGGWGYLLGDEGSAFHIGLSALRLILRREEERAAEEKRQRKRGSSSTLASSIAPSSFEQQACSLLGVPSAKHLVEATYASPPDCFKHWVARLCPLVFAYAFPSDDRHGSYDEQSHLLALSLVQEAAKGLVETGERLLRAAAVAEDDGQASGPAKWTLVVAGGLFANSPAFVELLLETWREKRRANHDEQEGDEQALFAAVRVLTHPAVEGAKALATSVSAGVAAKGDDAEAAAAAAETTPWWGKLPQAWLGW